MATLKMGALVTQIVGKIGGTIFQRSKVGQIARNKASHTNLDSNSAAGKLKVVFGGKTLTIFSFIASLWRTLTAAQRNTWDVGAVNFPFKNKFGEAYTGSGFQVFTHLNGNLAQNNQPTLNDCPLPAAVPEVGNVTVTYDPAIGIQLALDAVVPAGVVVIISSCVKQSAGRAFVPGRMKRIDVISPAAGFPYFANAKYQEFFGEIPMVGATYIFQVQYLWVATGQLSQPSLGYITVA